MFFVTQCRFVLDKSVKVIGKQCDLLTVANTVVGNACLGNGSRDFVKFADCCNVFDLRFRHQSRCLVDEFHYVVRSVGGLDIFRRLDREEVCPNGGIVSRTVFGYDSRQAEVGVQRRVVHAFCDKVLEVCVEVVDTVGFKQRVFHRAFGVFLTINVCCVQNGCLNAVEGVVFDRAVVEGVTTYSLYRVGKFDVGKFGNLFKRSCRDRNCLVERLVACALLACRILQQDVAVVRLGVQHSVERSDVFAVGIDFGKSLDVCKRSRTVSGYFARTFFFHSTLFVVLVPVVIHAHAVKRFGQGDCCKFGFGKGILAYVLQRAERYACKRTAVEGVVAYLLCAVKSDCFECGRSKCVVADGFHRAEVGFRKGLGIVECVVADGLDALQIDVFQRYAVVECIIADCLHACRQRDRGKSCTSCRGVQCVLADCGRTFAEDDGGDFVTVAEYVCAHFRNGAQLDGKGTVAVGEGFRTDRGQLGKVDVGDVCTAECAVADLGKVICGNGGKFFAKRKRLVADCGYVRQADGCK